MIKTILFGTLAVLLLSVTMIGQSQADTQESNKDQELVEHFVDTETIPLKGKLDKGDFILLMDITPFVSETGHLALKVPCGPNGEQLLTAVSGIAPDVNPMNLEYVEALSNAPDSCVYHAEIEEGVTDIALANTSGEKVRFYGKSSAGYSATITIQGKSI